MDKIHFAPPGKQAKPLLTDYLLIHTGRRIIIPGFLRWCTISSIHSMVSFKGIPKRVIPKPWVIPYLSQQALSLPTTFGFPDTKCTKADWVIACCLAKVHVCTHRKDIIGHFSNPFAQTVTGTYSPFQWGHTSKTCKTSNERPPSQSKLEDDWPESIFPQALIQPRTAPRDFSRKWSAQAALFQAAGRKLLSASCCTLLHASALCKLLCASALSKLLCASALRQLLRASALRMCSVQVGLCKLLCASCSVQALCACALCKLLCASALSKLLCAIALRQLLRASALRMCSVQVGLCKLLCASALCNCSVQVALRKLLCASDSAQVALRKCCRSCGNVLRIFFLYLKVAREHAPQTTSVLKSCDFPAAAAGVRSAYYVAIFKPELRGCAPRTTFVLKSCDFPA